MSQIESIELQEKPPQELQQKGGFKVALQPGLEPRTYRLIFLCKVTVGLKEISFRAGMVTAFPVLGFRPGREFLAQTSKFSNP